LNRFGTTKKTTKLAKRRHPNRKNIGEEIAYIDNGWYPCARWMRTHIQRLEYSSGKNKERKENKNKNKKTKNNKISLPNSTFFFSIWVRIRFLFNLLRIGEYIWKSIPSY
jgi:hypothetical protein